MITSPTTRQTDPFIGKVFLNKYTLRKKLGEGSFGKIYRASSNEGDFALKLEKKSKGNNLLELEGYIINYLKGPGIPQFKSYTPSTDYNVLVMQLLGKSLEDLLIKHNTFSIRTICNLSIQMIDVIKRVHDKHIIHRDIKPDNFTMGLNALSNHLYLIDFGLAKKYRSSKTLEQYPLKTGKKLTGTARYASVNALGGVEQSRRDDLESIAYVLVYLVKGSLPWQGLPIKKKEDRYKKIHDKKKMILPEQLCMGLPPQFQEFVVYTKGLEYAEEPKYGYLKELMKSVLFAMNETFDYYCDWVKVEKTHIDKDKEHNNNNNKHIGFDNSGSPNNEVLNSCNANLIEEQHTDLIKSGIESQQQQQQQQQQSHIIQEQEEKGITVVNKYYQQINNIVIHQNPNNNNDINTIEHNNNNNNKDQTNSNHLLCKTSNINILKDDSKCSNTNNNNNNININQIPTPDNVNTYTNIVVTNNIIPTPQQPFKLTKTNEAQYNESNNNSYYPTPHSKQIQTTLPNTQLPPSTIKLPLEEHNHLTNNNIQPLPQHTNNINTYNNNNNNNITIHKDLNQSQLNNDKPNNNTPNTVGPLFQKKLVKEHKGSKCCLMYVSILYIYIQYSF